MYDTIEIKLAEGFNGNYLWTEVKRTMKSARKIRNIKNKFQRLSEGGNKDEWMKDEFACLSDKIKLHRSSTLVSSS